MAKALRRGGSPETAGPTKRQVLPVLFAVLAMGGTGSCRPAEPACFPFAGMAVEEVLQECGEPSETVEPRSFEELESECSTKANSVLLYHDEGSTTVVFVSAEGSVVCVEFRGTFFVAAAVRTYPGVYRRGLELS